MQRCDQRRWHGVRMLQRRGLFITATIDAEFERRRHRRSVHDVSQSSKRRRHVTRDVTMTAHPNRAVTVAQPVN